MKFSAIVALFVAFEAEMHQSSAKPLAVTTRNCASCSVGTYCTKSLPVCHGPPEANACFNSTIAEYQIGCVKGYDCFDNLCECVIEDTVAITPTAPTVTPTSTPTVVSTIAPTAAPTRAPASGFFSQCPTGTYWEIGATACRGPTYAGECYNPATAKYQNGCAPGFTCINNKCSTIPPATFSPSVCYLKCATSGQYCENGTNFCRGPRYAGECFNIATGRYQNACGRGFVCARNMCVRG